VPGSRPAPCAQLARSRCWPAAGHCGADARAWPVRARQAAGPRANPSPTAPAAARPRRRSARLGEAPAALGRGGTCSRPPCPSLVNRASSTLSDAPLVRPSGLGQR
jgi:hypothetical protein